MFVSKPCLYGPFCNMSNTKPGESKQKTTNNEKVVVKTVVLESLRK